MTGFLVLPRPCADCGSGLVHQPRSHNERTYFPLPGGMRFHHCKGRCGACYNRPRVRARRERQQLRRVPSRRNRVGAHVYQDWLELSSQGYSRRDAAARLGMNYPALDQAIRRYRKKAA